MKPFLLGLLVASICIGPSAYGAVSDADFEELRQQLVALSTRVEELAAENAELRQSQAQTATEVVGMRTTVADVQQSTGDSWTDRVRLDGDFRYRYEHIDVEGSDARKRNRIRARTNVRADLSEDIEVGFGLATGGDDPVSTNQTLGAGGSSKNVRLNLAYADWEAMDNLHLIAGKYKNPMVRVGSQALLFDGDWTPEGFAARYQRDWFFGNLLGSWFESDTRSNNDSFGWGLQVGATGEVAGAKLTGGVSYYSIPTRGKQTSFGDPTDPADFYGNTAVEIGGLPCGTTGATCVYVYDYLLTELFVEAAFDIGDLPAVVFADYVKNSDPSENNTGWTVGTRIGQAKDWGQWQFSYFYADKQADALLGLVTDSDFGGGGSDNKGHFLKVDYGINKTWSVGAQYFINEIDVASGNRRDYNRLMIDTQWKWK